MVLALAMKVLGSLSWQQVVVGLAAIAGVFVILGVASIVLAEAIPTLLALSGALALMGLAAVLFGAGALMVALALTMLGKATKSAVASIIAALIMLIGVGILVLAVHPAMHSLGAVTLIGMSIVLLMAVTVPPFLFRMYVRCVEK